MSIYFQQDIKTFDDGELDLSSGDLELAGVRQSQRQLMINILNTTRGGYRGDPLVGWGAESYMGQANNPMTHIAMSADLRLGIQEADDVALEDIDYNVSYLTEEEVAIVLRHNGVIFEPDGTQPTTVLLLGWKFSFLSGVIETIE